MKIHNGNGVSHSHSHTRKNSDHVQEFRQNQFQLPLWAKLSLILLALGLVFQPRFSVHYDYIHPSDIPRELVRETIKLPRSIIGLPLCENKVLDNGSLLPVPDLRRPQQVVGDGLQSGQYLPRHCKPQFSSAVLVPHRNRTKQLNLFLPYLHNFLMRQEIHYRIFVIHQGDSKPWNKGKLFNAGARVAMELGFPCFILHDVDLLPLHEANIYACTKSPRHMSASIDKFRYNLPYKYLTGGALAITASHYKAINGFSNRFEMWGGEDDDLSERIAHENLTLQRFPPERSKYTMMKHKQEPKNDGRYKVMEGNYGRHKEDGLSTLKYKRMTILSNLLYTNITVEL